MAWARGFAPPPADSLWHQIYGPIESAMGSQQHMIQFATIGMIIALFIIWWRK